MLSRSDHIRHRSSERNPRIIGCYGGPLFLILLAGFIFICLFTTACTQGIKRKSRHYTIAVWKMDNLSPLESESMDMGELFSLQISEVIKSKGSHRVVEREQLELALEELSLGTTSLVDQSTRLKLGRLVGAHLMVFGAFQIFSGTMRIDLKLVSVETGMVLSAASNTARDGDVEVWLKTVQAAAEDLLFRAGPMAIEKTLKPGTHLKPAHPVSHLSRTS